MRLATLLVACLALTASITARALTHPADPPAAVDTEPAPARTSPFDAIFIDDDGVITVRVERPGGWAGGLVEGPVEGKIEGAVEGRLVSIDGLGVEALVDSARLRFGSRWKKRIAEDLADAMEAATGQRPPAIVRIVIKTEGGRREVEAAFTRAKRDRIWASDYGQAPESQDGDGESEAMAEVEPRNGAAVLDLAGDLMETRWSYRHVHPDIDVRSALRKAAGRVENSDQPPTTADMVAAMLRVLAMFPDGHAGLGGWREEAFPAALPAMTVWMGPDEPGAQGGRVALLRVGEGGVAAPVDAAMPYLVGIDGVPIERWLEVARQLEPTARSGSDWHAAKLLRHVPLLRHAMGRDASDKVLVRLASADGGEQRDIEVSLTERRSENRPRPWRAGEGTQPFDAVVPEVRPGTPQAVIDALGTSHGGRRTLEGGVGYIQLTSMDASAETITGLMEAMDAFGEAPGLIIDVRGNGGGSRVPLLVLWRYLAGPDEAPRVVTLARPLLGPDGKPQAELGGSRFMYPGDWSGWSNAERTAIAAFVESFQPQWKPTNAFGAWHYLVLGGALNARETAYLREPEHYDGPVAVLMDGDCFSATSIFLAALATRENVTLVGTPAPAGSGRTRSHDISRDPRLGLRLSTMASFQPDGRPFDGNVIEPDVVRWPTLADLAGETDTQLDAALEALHAAR